MSNYFKAFTAFILPLHILPVSAILIIVTLVRVTRFSHSQITLSNIWALAHIIWEVSCTQLYFNFQKKGTELHYYLSSGQEKKYGSADFSEGTHI